ncbi:DNA repair protein xrcc2 [Coemansia sp. RSA 2050]|nr:DNA repair protein xrcc2 [Coemansia sp. RSA 2050]KAJ2732621.1 DNA repair protein xrcc2 [Coemansia sp. BCRC 34962]
MTTELDRLLSQIKSESARNVAGLAPLPPKHTAIYTDIEALDDALREIYSIDERGSGGGPLLELLGLPGSGKTQTLYHICATAALSGQCVLFVDIDGKSSVQALAQHMKGLCNEPEAVTEALRLVHFFSPCSTQSLIATLAMLPRYAQELSPKLLVLDGLGSNYWADRKESVHVRLRSKRASAFFRLQQLLVDTLQMAHQRLGCLAVATSLLLLPALDSAPRLASQDSDGAARVIGGAQHEYRDHMIQRWSSVVSRSFVMGSKDVGGQTKVTFTPASSSRSQQARQYSAYVNNGGLRANFA